MKLTRTSTERSPLDAQIIWIDSNQDRSTEFTHVLSQSLSSSIYVVDHTEQAMYWLKTHEPALLVLELTTNDPEEALETQVELLRTLHNTCPGTPALLTMGPDEPLLDLLHSPQLRRPFQAEELLRTVGSLLNHRLPHPGLFIDLLALLAHLSYSGQIRVVSGYEYGEIGFRGGDIVHARSARLMGQRALAYILGWQKTRLLKPRAVACTDNMEPVRPSAALLEWTQHNHDHQLTEELVATDLTEDQDTSEIHANFNTITDNLPLGDELDDISLPSTTLDSLIEFELVEMSQLNVSASDSSEDELIDIDLQFIEAGSDITQHEQQQEREELMSSANINRSLEQLQGLSGYVGVSLVDSQSGMMLGSDGGGSINMEVAAAANSEVVKSKRQAIKHLKLKEDIEDILITLDNQYHLIRPFKRRPTLFFYLVLDRSRSNLALARMELADVENELEL